MMKKIICLVALVCATLSVLAKTPTITAKCKILINSANSISKDNIMAAESPSWSDAFDNGYDGTKYSISGSAQIWAAVAIGDLATIATNNLDGTPLTVKTIADEEYTITFESVSGTLMFLDVEADSLTAIDVTKTYKFTAPKNQTIKGRFFIVKTYTPDPGNLEVCHIGDNLEIRNNPYTANIVIKDAEGTKVMDRMPVNTPQTISLADLPKGRYTVEFNDGAEKFVISVKPDVTYDK